MIESLLSIALMCCCLYMFWRVGLRRWLVLALGFFLSTSNVVSFTIMELVSIFVDPRCARAHGAYKFIHLALNLELVIWSSMIAIGLGLVLKGMWDNYRMKQKNSYITVKN